MPNTTPAFRAGGNILCNRFVSIDRSTPTGTDFVVTQSVAASRPIGVSQDGSKRSPGVQSVTIADSLIAAEAGDPISIYGLGDVCNITVGEAAAINAGTLLAPDAQGCAIAAASTKWWCAIALEDAPASPSTSTAGTVGGVSFVRALVVQPALLA